MKGNKVKITAGVVGACFIGLVILLFAAAHGTIEAKGFCDFCHTQYYDVDEYAFNDKVGMEKPSGVLVGCAECHPQPYREFKASPHFEADEEKRPGCSNCHEPHGFFAWYRYMYQSPPEWENVQLSLHDNLFWEEEVRPGLAMKARKALVVSGSKPCKVCHLKTFKEKVKAHKRKLEELKGKPEDLNCIGCHYNFVHAEVPWDDKKEDIKKWLGGKDE